MASKQSDFVQEKLAGIEEAGLYRRLRAVSAQGPLAIVDGRKAVHLCSNDYLGLSRNRRVVRSAASALRQVSQCSSRLIAGNDPAIPGLEKLLARHRNTEAALVYPTGYAANLGAISALAGKDSVIFSDELNHASIIDACRLSGAAVKIFRHNDDAHLARLLREEKNNNKRKMVITEGIFSMDGDFADMEKICALAREHGAMTVVDDAHGDFIIGPRFSGVPAAAGAAVDVHVSSLSKGLGCFGGYVACSESVRELLINTSRQFIYTSALPDHLCTAAITAVPIAKKGDLQKRLRRNIERFTTKIVGLGFTLGPSRSQIIPVMIGDERKAVTLSWELLEAGAFAQAVRYPTVKRGSARLRVSLTAMHEQEHVDEAIDAFKTAGKKSGII